MDHQRLGEPDIKTDRLKDRRLLIEIVCMSLEIMNIRYFIVTRIFGLYKLLTFEEILDDHIHFRI